MTDKLRSRRIRSGVALTTAVLAMVATAGTAASAAAAGKAHVAASGSVASIAKLVPPSYRKRGTLTVAVATYPPSAIQPGDGSQLTGWDVENTRAILKLLGLKADFKVIAFNGVVPGLQSGRFDLATGEIYITPARTKVVSFVSNHISQDAIMVAAHSRIRAAKTMESLCGLTLTATLGSAEMDLANQVVASCDKAGKTGTNVKTFETAAQMNLALTGGRADAEIGSASQVSYVVQQTGAQFRTIALPWSTSYDTGLAISRNADSQRFAKAVAAATNYLIKNGTLQKILNKWNSGMGLAPHAKILPAHA